MNARQRWVLVAYSIAVVFFGLLWVPWKHCDGDECSDLTARATVFSAPVLREGKEVAILNRDKTLTANTVDFGLVGLELVIATIVAGVAFVLVKDR